MPTSIRLPSEYEQRLDYLSKQTGRSKAFYIKQLIMDHLDDLEDVYLAEQRLEQLRQGHDEIVNSEEFWGGLDVDDQIP
ncbi:MAG: TraY domain-containing protein [Desulfovermiculus sp.]